MSVSSIEVIKDRALNSEGGIAVFNGKRAGGMRGSLDAVPADTVHTVNAIKRKDAYYICTLTKKMSIDEIDKALKNAKAKCMADML